MYRLLIIICLLANPLLAQKKAYGDPRQNESIYRKLRTDNLTIRLSDYDLKDSVKSVYLVSTSIVFGDTSTYTEQYGFSPEGLLTVHIEGDTIAILKSSGNVHTGGTWYNYNQNGQLQGLRKREYFSNGQIKEHRFVYDTSGFLRESYVPDRGVYSRIGKITYNYFRRDSLLVMKPSPQTDLDIEGNVLCDSAHFYFGKNGRITGERVFRFGGDEYLSLHDNQYMISGRSNMLEGGAVEYDSLGRLIAWRSSGYRINQQGTHSYSSVDSLVYNEHGLLSERYWFRYSEGDGWLFQNAIVAPATQMMKLVLHYTYTFDVHGNWITRTAYDAQDRIVSSETREIIYY